jgi:hypothetical protein
VGQHPGEAEDARLRGAVGGMLVKTDARRLRGDVDDLPAARLDHGPADLLGPRPPSGAVDEHVHVAEFSED